MKPRSLLLTGVTLSLLLSACVHRPPSLTTSQSSAGQLEWFVGIPWGEGNANGTGEAARFAGPLGLAPDPRGGLLIADQYGDTVRRADADFRVTTIAGASGVGAFRDGEARHARFDSPTGLAAAADGTIYVADQGNHVIRKITPEGRVVLLAGSPGQTGSTDGRGTKARFDWPTALTLDADGRLWVADRFNKALRIVSPNGYVSTWPGQWQATATATHDTSQDRGDIDFPGIEHLAFAPDGTLVVAGEWGVSRIKGSKATRLLTVMSDDERQSLASSALANAKEPLPEPIATQVREALREGPHVATINGLAIRADGVIFLADKSQGLVFRLEPNGETKVVAGRMTKERHSGADGPMQTALLDEPGSLAFDREGRLFVASKSASIQQILPDGGIRNVLGLARWYEKRDIDPARLLHGSCDVAVEDDRGNLFVVQRLDDEIHQFDASGRRIRQFGKDSGSLSTPDSERHVDGEAARSRFRYPQDIVAGRSGEMFVADGGGIRRIDADGRVSTLAGRSSTPARRDGKFEEARFFRPYRLAFDGSRYLYVLDNSPYVGGGPVPAVVRSIDLETRLVSTVIAEPEIERMFSDIPADAIPYFPTDLLDLAMGPGGRLYVLGKAGGIYTWRPGEGLKVLRLPFSLMPASDWRRQDELATDAKGKPVENHLIRSARPSGSPDHLAVDSHGNIYLSDGLADLVLRLDHAGNLDVIAGTPGMRGNVAAPLPGTLDNPEGISITPQGDLLITVLYSGVIRVREPHRVPGLRIPLEKPGNQ